MKCVFRFMKFGKWVLIDHYCNINSQNKINNEVWRRLSVDINRDINMGEVGLIIVRDFISILSVVEKKE